MVNGEPCGLIHPFRGIRQGDLLSSFFFLLCIEGLNGLINNVELNGDIHGFSLRKRGPKLTYLLFADDSLLFCRATSDECSKVLNILETYEVVSSQKVNRSKTTLFLANPLLMVSDSTLNWLWAFQRLCSTKNIWAFHPLSEKERKQASIILKKGCGGNSKIGKGSYSLRLEVRC